MVVSAVGKPGGHAKKIFCEAAEDLIALQELMAWHSYYRHVSFAIVTCLINPF